MRRGAVVATALAGAVSGAALLVRRGYGVLRSKESVAAYWRDRADVDGELLYVALGDSTAQALGASSPDEGYVGRLADDLAARRGRSVRVVNLSVSGARVADLVRDQLPVLADLLCEGSEPALVTVTIGANDTGRTSHAAFAADMMRIVDALPAGARVADVPYFRGGRGDDALALSAVIRELVAERGHLVQVDLWGATRHMRPREYAADFFHPSTRGYDRYYRAFSAVEPD